MAARRSARKPAPAGELSTTVKPNSPGHVQLHVEEREAINGLLARVKELETIVEGLTSK